MPNGDVVLCFQDFGLKHVIGNLREQDFESLYTSQEFLFVQRGLADESLDILCRSCEWAFEYTFYSFCSRVQNRFLSELRAIKTPRDALMFVPRVGHAVAEHARKD